MTNSPSTNAAPANTYTFALRVFHNITDSPDRFLDGYADGDPLVPVFDLTVEASGIHTALNAAHRLLNVGDDPDFGVPDDQAVAYRAAGNRSLSIGDVLVADGVAFVSGRVGWQQISVDPAQVQFTAVPGSTPLDVSRCTA